jgi:N-acetylglucosaminyl-diphospho-decaprenol L-rhamnosyltransferase
MKNLNDLTVIIVTYKTKEKIIFDCIKSINSDVNVLIIENSNKFIHEKIILSNFPNVKILCTGNNLGYGRGNNFGLKLVKTSFALILNPDVICDRDFFNNIIDVLNKVNDFTIIGCQYLNDKIFMPAGFFNKHKNANFKDNFKNNKVESLSKVEWVTGCSMLINLKKFDDKEIFDKNFFLYFEEIDLCKSVIKKNENIFTSQKLKIHHLGFQSSTEIESNNKINLNKVREWHWMWSSFYFYKKNYSYLYAFYQMFGKLLKSLIKFSFYSITFQKNKKNKYLYRFLGLVNSFLNKPSHFREDK